MIKDAVDLRGGFSDSIPSILLSGNELLEAQNCHWVDGLVKRSGHADYLATDMTGTTYWRGAKRVKLGSTWLTLLAADDDTDVHFKAASTTAIAPWTNSITWQTGYQVRFAQLGDYVVAVNGYNKPVVIYYDVTTYNASTNPYSLVIANLETYDERDREKINWGAGQWDDDAAVPFVDDTADAQDAGTADFAIDSTTNNDGFYVTCDFTFNRVILYGCEQLAGSPVMEATYWNGTAWTALTMVSTPAWTDVEANKVFEFNLPLDSTTGELLWKPYEEDTTADDIVGKYILRVRFTTAPSSATNCDYLEVANTQYLSQVMCNGRPSRVWVHNDQMFMADDTVVYMSPFASVKGWQEWQLENFVSGGSTITGMRSFQGTLTVFKEKTIYTLDTTNYTDPVKSQPLAHMGAVTDESIVDAGAFLVFVGTDGIYKWDGSKATKISKHIQAFIDTLTLTNSCGIFYKGEVWLSFPTNSKILVFDPDTLRTDSSGDERVSFYRWTGYRADYLVLNDGAADNGYLLAVENSTVPTIRRCNTGAYDVIATVNTAISEIVQTKYFSQDSIGDINTWGRLKPIVGETTTASTYAFQILADDGDDSVSFNFDVGAGTGIVTDDYLMPYELDGRNISIKMTHSGLVGSKVYGFSFDQKKRRY